MNNKNNKEFDEILSKLGKNIKKYREKAGLTQENIAEGKDGIEYKYVQKIEYGQVNLTLKSLYKLSKKLNVDIKKLFDFKD